MSVNISVFQALSLYMEGQHHIKIGQKLLDKFKSEKERNSANLELHKRGTELVTQGTNYINLAKNVFSKRFITRIVFNKLLA